MIFSGKKVGAKLRQCKISHFPRENKKAGSIGRVGRASEDQKGRSTPVGAPAGSAGEADFLGGSQVLPALSDSSDRSDSSDMTARPSDPSDKAAQRWQKSNTDIRCD